MMAEAIATDAHLVIVLFAKPWQNANLAKTDIIYQMDNAYNVMKIVKHVEEPVPLIALAAMMAIICFHLILVPKNIVKDAKITVYNALMKMVAKNAQRDFIKIQINIAKVVMNHVYIVLVLKKLNV